MKKPNTRKLHLDRETLVALDRGTLDGVQGGASIATRVPSVCAGTLCDRAKSWIQACPQ